MYDGEETFICRLFMSDLPEKVSVEMLQEAAERDPTYIRLRETVRQERREPTRSLCPTCWC